MTPDRQDTFTDDVARAIARLDPDLERRLGKDPQAHLDLVVLTDQARSEVSALLGAAVASARAAGWSWESVGSALGMSRQAAQQRFGRGGSDQMVEGDTRRLVGLSAFKEMETLDEWGRHGWHSVGFGPMFHDVQVSDVQWQHKRVVVGSRAAKDLDRAGWERISGMWFPWVYFARSTGAPAEAGEPE